MSESSSLLMNMGAEVATASGPKPMLGQHSASDGNADEFANILKAVLPVNPQTSDDPRQLLARQIETNPLLFSQLSDSDNQLLQQDDIDLEAMFDGKSLPAEEQKLAWQSLLTEYDSANPDTPRLVVARGDDKTYQVEEFKLVEDMPLTELDDIEEPHPEALSGLADAQANVINPDGQDKPDLRHAPELNTNMTSTGSLDAAKLAGSPVTTTEGENSLQLDRLQQTDAQQGVKKHTPEAANIQSERQSDNNRLSSDRLEQLAGQSESDFSEMSNTKSDIPVNLATESSAVKALNTTTNNSSGVLGASTYSAVSGLGNVNSTSQLNGQVIASLTVPPQNPAWGDIVGDRVQWMATQNIQEAKIRLNPPELGLLEVRVQVGNDHQTTISFTSPHSQVRDALETALPRLREMFGENGLSLGDVNVSHQSMSEQGHAERDNDSHGSGKNLTNSTKEISELALPQHTSIAGNGMLDLYA